MKKICNFLLILSLFCFLACNLKKTEGLSSNVKVFTLYSSDVTEPLFFDDEIAKEITRRSGVSIKFIPRNDQEIDDIDIMIANNSFPDLIFAKGTLTHLIESKSVIPLDEFIEKYGTNIKNLYKSQIVKLRNTLDDPSIYNIGTYEISGKVLETSGNLQLQNAVLREFGYPEIKTLEDYENIIKAYIKKYPVINGHKTIGFSLLTDSWYWYLGLSNPGNYVIGLPDDGQWIVDQNTMEATYKFLNPQMKTFYKWLNKIYNEGLLDPECFIQDFSAWQTKLTDGYVLGTAAPFYFFQDIQNGLIQNGFDNRTFAFLPVVDKKDIKDQMLKDYGFSGGWGIAISKDCYDKEGAFKFLDWLCSEEAQILINWGIEGIDYYYKDGKRIGISENDAVRGVGHWIYPFPQGGAGFIDSTGNPIAKISREEVIKKYTMAEKETLKAYGATMWIDLFTPSEEIEKSKHGQVWQYPLNSQLTQLVKNVDDYVKESIIKMIISSPEKFDSNWNDMTTEIKKMGIEDVENEITKLIQMKLQLWAN